MNRENLGIGLLILFDQEAAPRIIAKAARIDTHHVNRGLTINNPMGKLPTRAPCGGDSETMTFVKPEVFEAPCRTDDGRPVGRVSDCAVINFLDSHLSKGGNTVHRCENIRLKPVKRVREKFVFTVRRWPIDIAGRCANLIRPEQQAARFLTHIIAGVGFAQHAHLG